MIGQLINKFDNLAENDSTLKTFNEMFKTDIKGKDSSLVEIGNIVTGGLREVFIDGVKTIVRINDNQDVTYNNAEKKRQGHKKSAESGVVRKKVVLKPKNLYIIKKEGKVIYTSHSQKDICEYTGLGMTSVQNRVTGLYNKNYNGMELSREAIGE